MMLDCWFLGFWVSEAGGEVWTTKPRSGAKKREARSVRSPRAAFGQSRPPL